MRLFFTLPFQSPALDAMEAVQTQLKTQCCHGRFSRREQLHLTLAFLGEVSPDRAPELKQILADTAEHIAPFSLCFDHLGAFPGANQEQLFYLSARPSSALTALERSLRQVLLAQGFRLETRNFLPHVTLGRRCRAIPGKNPLNLDFPTIAAPVSSAALMQSEQPGGILTYTSLAISTFTPQ